MRGHCLASLRPLDSVAHQGLVRVDCGRSHAPPSGGRFTTWNSHSAGWPAPNTPVGLLRARACGTIPPMTKSELIARLAAHYPQLTVKDVEAVVKAILVAMTESLVDGRRIEIRGFGSWELNYRPPRTGRNPKTGDPAPVPGKFVPHFKAGKELRKRVDTANAK